MKKVFLAILVLLPISGSASPNLVDCKFSGFQMKSGVKSTVSGEFHISDSLEDSNYSTDMEINYEGSKPVVHKKVITVESPGDSMINETPKIMLKELEEGNTVIPARWKNTLEKIVSSDSSTMYSFPFTFSMQGAYVYRYYDSTQQEVGKIFSFGNNVIVVCD